jgi:hypothetical protein
MGNPDTFTVDAMARREVELTAMKAVMDIEASLGYIPIDVSGAKVGYGIVKFVGESETILQR